MNELDVIEKSIPIFCNLKKKFWSYFFWIPLLISLTSLEEKLERKVELIWEIQREVCRNSSLGGWWGQPWGQWAHWGPFRGWVKCAKETSGMELGPVCSFNRLLSGGQGEKVAYSCLPLVLCPVPGIPGFSSLSSLCMEALPEDLQPGLGESQLCHLTFPFLLFSLSLCTKSFHRHTS